MELRKGRKDNVLPRDLMLSKGQWRVAGRAESSPTMIIVMKTAGEKSKVEKEATL